jgi:uroporphyrin-III C-methyltransferase
VLALAPNARKIPVGKRSGQVSADQAFINRLLVASAREGGVVVRLKGGDPMIFGRAHEEILACANASIDVEVVPGITAASAAAAHLGASLTMRGVARSVVFVTPTVAKNGEHDDAWADAAFASQTVAIYMGAREAQRVMHALVSRGTPLTHPVVLVQDAGRPEAHHKAGCLNDLPELAGNLGAGPVILLLGDVFADVMTSTNQVPHELARHA